MKNKLEPAIYIITNKVNGKVYVGQAQFVTRRLYEHKYHLERGTDKSTVLQRSVEKYGLDNFSMSVLEICPIEKLNEREIYWIEQYKSNNKEYGYNLSSGGESGLRGYKFPKEFGERISARMTGKHLTEEHKQKISTSQKGKPKPIGMGAKLSAAISGKNHWNWGKETSAESKDRMSKAHSGENNHNFGKKLGGSSKYFGVSKSTSKRKYTYWSACVNWRSKRTGLGIYKDELEAAKAYDAYVREHNLPHPLNFP